MIVMFLRSAESLCLVLVLVLVLKGTVHYAATYLGLYRE